VNKISGPIKNKGNYLKAQYIMYCNLKATIDAFTLNTRDIIFKSNMARIFGIL
jgi:hypothetical protein